MKRVHLRSPVARLLRVFLTLLVFLCAVHILQAVVREVSTSPLFRTSVPEFSEYTDTHVRFLLDGTYHTIQSTVTRQARGRHERYSKIYDANDQLLWEGLSSGENPEKYLRWASGGHLNSNGRWMSSRHAVRAEFSQALEVLVNTSETSYWAWRYQRHNRIFAGYTMQGQVVGYVGRNGFVTERSRCQPFDRLAGFLAWVPEGTRERKMLWLTRHGLYQIDFTEQILQSLFESPEVAIAQVRTHGWLSLSPEDHDYVDCNLYRPLIDCETEDGSHHLILREPEEIKHCVLPSVEEERTIRQTQVTATRKDIFLVRHTAPKPEPTEPWPHPWERSLYRLDSQGVLQEITRSTSSLSPRVRMAHGNTVFEQGVRIVSPLGYRVFGPQWFLGEGVLAAESFRWFATVMPVGIGPWFLSLLCVVMTVWHAWNRQSSWVSHAVWLVFVGVFNVAGLLTYLALHHAVLVRCGACGKKRSLTRPSCVHCAAGLPRPQPEHTILIPA